jgi:type II secretory pathway pseudopilin PulG
VKREHLKREAGMTLVEVVVAGMILIVGALGVFGIVEAGTRNVFRAEQSQMVANLLQQEVEKLRGVPYSELALTSLPSHSSEAENPNSRIYNTDSFYTGRDDTGLKPLVYKGDMSEGETIKGGTVDPGPTSVQIGDLKAKVYRYVVWDTCPSTLCQGGKYLKRAVVVVRLDTTAPGGSPRYQEIQGQFVDPEVEPAVLPEQEPGGSDDESWTLLLTDTPCNEVKRLTPPIENGDHATHNTRGNCANGPQAGTTPGAPDLLWWPEAPNGKSESEVDYPYDYATDVEPKTEGGADEGLQIEPGGECDAAATTELAIGVAKDPDPHPNAYKEVHRWLSPPVPPHEGEQDLLLTGEGTLSLWTRTLGATPYTGEICAWIFARSESAGKVTDTLVVNLGPPTSLDFSYFAQSWPSSGWTEITLPLSFGHAEEGGALPLPPGSRLGLALSVGSGTSSALQLRYDMPSFDSRIQVTTTGAPPPEA